MRRRGGWGVGLRLKAENLERFMFNIQIPSTKLQINLKFQCSMTKTFKDETLFGFSNFGHWAFV